MEPTLKITAGTIAVVAALLALGSQILGYSPGDAPGASRMSMTISTSLVAIVLAMASLLPLGVVRVILLIGSAVFLLMAIGSRVGFFD